MASSSSSSSVNHHSQRSTAEAISSGYNFRSTWEQNAPLTEQQHAAIAALSHAVVERPFPDNVLLSQDQNLVQDSGLTVSTKANALEDFGAMEAIIKRYSSKTNKRKKNQL